MTTKIKKVGLATIVFLLGIILMTCFVVRERNILDLGYLILLIFYFVKFLVIKWQR